MHKVQFGQSLRLCWFNVKLNRNLIIGWAIAMFAFMFLYMILFPSIQEMAQVKLEVMPKELLEFVGMDRLTDMSDFVSYFGIIYNLAIIAMSIFAVTFSANLLLKEEKYKTIEFLSALELSRTELFLAKLMTALFAVVVVRCASTAAVLICGFINGGETFSVIDVLNIVILSGFTPFFFLGIGLFLAAISAKIGAPALGGMTVIFCYLFGYLGNILEKSWLTYLSPFEVFQAEHALSPDTATLTALACYLALWLCLLIIGVWRLNRRDFAV